MLYPSQRRYWAAWAIALLTTYAGASAFQQAVRWYQHPFAGVLITPQGIVSSIGMPTWSGIEQGLRFPDRPLSIDGVPLTSSRGEYAARAWDRAIDEAVALGHRSVHVRVAASGGEREIDLRLERLDSTSWWLYGGVTIFTGGLYALAAVIAIGTGSGGLARTFAKSATL